MRTRPRHQPFPDIAESYRPGDAEYRDICRDIRARAEGLVPPGADTGMLYEYGDNWRDNLAFGEDVSLDYFGAILRERAERRAALALDLLTLYLCMTSQTSDASAGERDDATPLPAAPTVAAAPAAPRAPGRLCVA